jgi:hypothetical protein
MICGCARVSRNGQSVAAKAAAPMAAGAEKAFRKAIERRGDTGPFGNMPP